MRSWVWLVQQHAEAVKRTQALRQKLNGRLNQAMSPAKQPATASLSRSTSGPASTSASQPASGPAPPSLQPIQPSATQSVQPRDQPGNQPTAPEQPTVPPTASGSSNGLGGLTSPRRARATWHDTAGSSLQDGGGPDGRGLQSEQAASGLAGGSATSPTSPQRHPLGRRPQPSTSMRECMTSLTPSSPNSHLFIARRTRDS